MLNSDMLMLSSHLNFKTFVAHNLVGRSSIDTLMAHCRREFFHAQWKELLDDEF